MGSRFVVFLLALVAVIAIVTGFYLHRKQERAGAPQAQSEQKPSEAPSAASKEAASPSTAEAPAAAPTEVPSFDVVRIEPTGEGVIAGHATPGWTVRLENAGGTIGETKADDEGAWTIILDKPLAAGAQALTLKAISPDGTRGVSSQGPVNIAVGPSTETAQAQPEPVVPDPNATPHVPHPAPPVRIGKVDYQDTGSDTGKISLSGTGDANEHVFFFFDDAPLAQVTIGADGTWTIDIDKKLPSGEHTIRADTYDKTTGMASGRASVNLGREPEAVAQGEQSSPSSQAQGEQPSASPEARASMQPEPVYPEGAPQPVAAPSASSVAAAEPVDLSKQPQPVVPEEVSEVPAAAPPSGEAATSSGEAASAPSGEAATSAPSGETGLASQPQPVYPDGQPDLSASASSTSMPAAPAPEPYDLSSQPQPVVPESMAEAGSLPTGREGATQAATGAEAPAAPSPVAGPPVGVSSQPQPVVPPEPSASTAAEEPATPKAPPVVFKSVDYQDKGADSGTVSLSGTGEPGTRIVLFFDEDPIGQLIIGDDGTWKFEAEKKVAVGEHSFRADHLDEKTGDVLGRASISIIRMEPPKEEAAAPKPEAPVAGEAPASAPPTAETSKAAPHVAASEEDKSTPAGSEQGKRKRHLPRVYTVRRGDTLWEIAEAYYGGGWHYRAIVKDNRKKIHNPRLIYPHQKFHIPRR